MGEGPGTTSAALIARIEADLRESRDRLELALRAARMGIWDWEVATGSLEWSPELEEVHGMEPGSFDGTFAGFLEVVHPDDREALERDIRDALAAGGDFSTEFRVVGRDGRLRWVAGDGRVVQDPAGRPVRMIGVGRDVSETRRAMEALRESERRFRAMADAAPVMIWTCDAEGLCTYVNAVWLTFTGRPLEEEIGEGWRDDVHPDDLDRCRIAFRTAIEGRGPYDVEHRLRRSDGTYRWVLNRGTARRGPGGRIEGLIGSCVDIEERHDAEQRDRLLAELGPLLNQPLSLDERLDNLVRRMLPDFADACVVDLIGDDGRLVCAASGHVDPALREALGALPPPRPDSPRGMVAASGEGMLITDAAAWVERLEEAPREAALRRRIGPRSAVVVPLDARGRRLGVMSLSTTRAHSDRVMNEGDLRLAQRVAARAALAIDNQALFEQERRARRRVQYLAEAGEVLNSSLDFESRLQALAGIVVPDLADWCTVHLVDEYGGIARAALAHADPERVRWAAELAERWPPDPDAPTGLPAVVRTGRAELIEEMSPEMLEAAARDDDHRRVIAELAPTSYLCVPLVARGSTLGALTLLTSAESGRRLGDDDLGLARQLAERAASAIDNARLYRDQRTIADTLQRALLPAELPPIPGARVSGAYVALGTGVEVGGDFYDVFPCADGRWLIVVGDVCGKGPEAASLTALARYTLRALAPLDDRPGRLLERLNAAVLSQRPGSTQFLTACAGLVEPRPGGFGVTLASAGHPPALLVRATGAIQRVPTRGSLLGIRPEIEIAEVAIEMAPGDRLLLYTDGVTEARMPGGGLLGDEGLQREVAALAPADGTDLATALADRVLDMGGGRVRDDIAVLVMEVAGPG